MSKDFVEPLAGFPVVLSLPIQWGDQDAFQHVNNTVYLRWFESARIKYGDMAGVGQDVGRVAVGPGLPPLHVQYSPLLSNPPTSPHPPPPPPPSTHHPPTTTP